MQRTLYRQKGTLIASDFLVNSGGVIYAAQEQLIKTPMHLRIPEQSLGKREEVDGWLELHSDRTCLIWLSKDARQRSVSGMMLSGAT